MNVECPGECKLRPVGTADDDVELLFSLLQRRQHGISHQVMPAFAEHKQFVLSHPYRAWFFVVVGSYAVGSVYLLDSNHIGVNIDSEYYQYMAPAIELLAQMYAPLPAIASVRAAQYQVNVSPENEMLIDALQTLGASVVQHTYLLK